MKIFCTRPKPARVAVVTTRREVRGRTNSLVALTAAVLVTLHPATPVHAVDDADNPYIQELLRKTETNREQVRVEPPASIQTRSPTPPLTFHAHLLAAEERSTRPLHKQGILRLF